MGGSILVAVQQLPSFYISLLLGAVLSLLLLRVWRIKARNARTLPDRRSPIVAQGIGGDHDLDAIIVGAGVAGAALAYTLGKVVVAFRIVAADLRNGMQIFGTRFQHGGMMAVGRGHNPWQ